VSKWKISAKTKLNLISPKVKLTNPKQKEAKITELKVNFKEIKQKLMLMLEVRAKVEPRP